MGFIGSTEYCVNWRFTMGCIGSTGGCTWVLYGLFEGLLGLMWISIFFIIIPLCVPPEMVW